MRASSAHSGIPLQNLAPGKKEHIQPAEKESKQRKYFLQMDVPEEKNYRGVILASRESRRATRTGKSTVERVEGS